MLPQLSFFSAILLCSWLLQCSRFNNDQTTRLLFETNVTKWPTGIGLGEFHRITRMTSSYLLVTSSEGCRLVNSKAHALYCSSLRPSSLRSLRQIWLNSACVYANTYRHETLDLVFSSNPGIINTCHVTCSISDHNAMLVEVDVSPKFTLNPPPPGKSVSSTKLTFLV